MHYKAAGQNIENTIVARISKENYGDFNFSGKSIASSASDVSGIITSSSKAFHAREITLYIKNCSQFLQDGDILLLHPSGGVRLLYRSTWYSNAIFLTNQCNNNCTCCPQPPKEDHDDLLGVAFQMIQLIQDESPVIGITGGEPTCVWENLVNIIAFTKATLPKSYLHLLTNARTLADYDKTVLLAEVSGGDLLVCAPLYSDVQHMHDAMTEVNGSYWEAISGLKNLARVSLPVEIRVLITQQNYMRLPQIAQFIYRNLPFASHVALMGIELVGYAARRKNDIWVSPRVYMPYLEEAVHTLEQRNMHASIYNHPLCIIPDGMKKYLRNSISEWKVSYTKACIECTNKSICPGIFPSVVKELETELKPYNTLSA